ncbi:hypothetical protein EVAR_100556_1 [Eumeta japonica]|uniref:Uncharacterized protein n=1 Tax=Eumeta variegata TaxID=151549 RepID=A0A4C2A2G2_EUMVA|nr:hypothetical protein EVAR_100556_1 [Eumeta japonica]
MPTTILREMSAWGLMLKTPQSETKHSEGVGVQTYHAQSKHLDPLSRRGYAEPSNLLMTTETHPRITTPTPPSQAKRRMRSINTPNR